ncbi:hypothetical protein [uncultured Massilia sp.]|uniref:hypothetical protein n=1 Tax=uncultured Massilia sp. TaxID=169973 RepID=UPI002590F65A|nr:hypothetical protein [uncultured Massilia sp.]
MSALERLAAEVLLVVLLVLSAWFGVRHYGAAQRQAGWDAAVAAGKEQRDHDAAIARETETTLRAQLRTQDAVALRKEQEHAESLEAAQRRVRSGVDRLRCPAAGPISAGTAAGDRPAAAGADGDGEGPAIVPEVAAEILGDAAAVAGLVRRYERVVERFDACRAMNSK